MKISNIEILRYLKNKYNKEISVSEINQLLIYVNGYKDYTELVINYKNPCKSPLKLKKLVNRIENGEPIQYVLNSAQFLDLDIYCDKGVLIPRPETEGLTKYVEQFINILNLNKETIVDCCTGTGCIGLYLKYKFNDSNVILIDKYSKPLKVCNINKERFNLDVKILKGDKINPLIKNNIKCDIFISNPPYIKNVSEIDKKVIKNEPMNALFAKNGIDFYKTFFKKHKMFLNEKYLMAFEMNYDQKDEIQKLVDKYFKNEKINLYFLRDIYNKDRYVFIFGGYDEIL